MFGRISGGWNAGPSQVFELELPVVTGLALHRDHPVAGRQISAQGVDVESHQANRNDGHDKHGAEDVGTNGLSLKRSRVRERWKPVFRPDTR